MSATAEHAPPLTYGEYLALERETDARHEFLDGEAWLMAGGTPAHSKIKTNAAGVLHAALRGRPCQVYDSDLKVRVAATGLTTYPDLSVVCGALERHPEDRNAITNPTVWLEVLSGSTEGWDRGGKFMHAQQVASLAHYVLVSQDTRRVEVFTRGDDGGWSYRAFSVGTAVPLTALGVEVDVDALYEQLPEG